MQRRIRETLALQQASRKMEAADEEAKIKDLEYQQEQKKWWR